MLASNTDSYGEQSAQAEVLGTYGRIYLLEKGIWIISTQEIRSFVLQYTLHICAHCSSILSEAGPHLIEQAL